ncbi:MAG: cofactor-independent phosphoglycerate mutase [Candidatus Lokiarchaeota archaeon]|nr:cofactor-independent phosphoglycerate mutase [Candidatus Lokiarchaeota archaeon]
MKYIILVCDGAADWPIEELGNKTIFEASRTPYLDKIASIGRMGLLKTVPDGMKPGSECANMSIMGYRPEQNLTGRGPLEALSAGVSLKESDIAFRCNLITIEDDLIKDYSSGHITTEEGGVLINYIQSNLKKDGIDFFPGVQYRHILRLDGNIYSEEIDTTPPHDVLDQDYKQFLPKPKDIKDEKANKTATDIIELIEQSSNLLINHEINKKRQSQGKRMATHIFPWSGGKKPNIEPFSKKFGLNGSVISAVDLIFGIGIAVGLEPIYVEGATGLPDTNYKGKVKAALKQLEHKEFVYLHIEAIDEMAHSGDYQKKMKALEDFDQFIVKPIFEAEDKFNQELCIAILPDHPTPCKIRTHSKDPVPFVIYNPQKKINKSRIFSEKNAEKGDYGLIENGESFMNLFIKS